jgi:membrane-bound ClpP family serine protease
MQDLHPSGKVDFEGKSIDVVSEGGFIEKDIRVEVVEVEGNRVVVRPVGEEA